MPSLFKYTATNYTGTYALVSMYDSYAQTTVDMGDARGFTLQLRPSSADDPHDDQDLYDLVLRRQQQQQPEPNTTTPTTNNNDDNDDDFLLVAQMTVVADEYEIAGQRYTDDIVEVYLVTTTIPETIQSDSAWSEQESIFYVVPYFTQIRFYDRNRTELVLGGPAGSMEYQRLLF